MTWKKKIICSVIIGPLLTGIGFGLMLLFGWATNHMGQVLAELGMYMSLGHYYGFWVRVIPGLRGLSFSDLNGMLVMLLTSSIDYVLLALLLFSVVHILRKKNPNKPSDATR